MSDYYKSSLSLPHAAEEMKMTLTSLRVLVLEGNINAVREEDGVWRIKPAELSNVAIRRSTSGFPSYDKAYYRSVLCSAIIRKLEQRHTATLELLAEQLPGTHPGQLRSYVRSLLRAALVRYGPGGVLELTGYAKSILRDADRRPGIERLRNSALAARA